MVDMYVDVVWNYWKHEEKGKKNHDDWSINKVGTETGLIIVYETIYRS